jgi:hypothetical protein
LNVCEPRFPARLVDGRHEPAARHLLAALVPHLLADRPRTEPAVTRKQLVDGLIELGYSAGTISAATKVFEDGGDPDRLMAVLHPEIARAFRARAWLDASLQAELDGG